jgi:hypothetical protein
VPVIAPGLLSVASVLALQRTAGNVAVYRLLRRSVLHRQVGWTGVDPGSWNAGPKDVPGAKGSTRVPVEGLAQGHASGGKQDDSGSRINDPEQVGVWKDASQLTPEASGGEKTGRAVVVIPKGLPANAASVEVLFHLHGFTPGGRGRGKTGTGEPEDVAVTRIGQQIEASGRAMVGVMPQGIKGSFWKDPSKFNLKQYVDDALALVPAAQWPGKKPRSAGGIILSAHSGGGDILAQMIKGGQVPSSVEGLFLFDSMHGWGPGAVADFLKARLDSDLAQLHGIWTAKTGKAKAEDIADDQAAWLQGSGFRFRGFASRLYKQTYKDFRPKLEAWFNTHAAELGGTESLVYKTLSANILDQSAVAAGTEHEQIVGGTASGGQRQNEHLRESLGGLRGSSPAATGVRVPAQPVVKPTAPQPAAPKPTPAKRPAGVSRDVKAPPAPTAGWAGVDKGSTNTAARTTEGTSIRRVPVKGVASGRDKGNALVLIPEWLPAGKTVEVLLHLHGHKWGGYGLGYETAEDEYLYRIEHALDQFKAAKRPIIGVLPQGANPSLFGKDTGEIDANVYIQQAIAAVPPAEWPSGPAPQAGGVILSGHSGAGGRFADMFGTGKMPAHLEGFFSFDTINGRTGQKVSEITKGNEYKQHLAFVLGKLDADLQSLKAERAKLSGQKEDQIQVALAGKLARDGFRFRAFYSGPLHVKADGTLDEKAESTYADRYFLLKGNVDAWFDAHAGDLGGKGSKAYAALRANYTIEAAGTDHMQDMGGVAGAKKGDPWQHENLKAALGALPTTPQGGP